MTDKRHRDRGFKDCGPDKDEWKREGIELAQRHDATVWEIGGWYLRGRQNLALASAAASSRRPAGKA